MSIIESLGEQCSFGFTGRLNVLKTQGKQYLGVVLISEGFVVSASFSKKSGLKALYSLVICDMEGRDDYTFVVEPEIIDELDIEFKLSHKELVKQASMAMEEHQKLKSLVPPMNLKLLIDKNFVEKGKKIDANEFSLLKTITEFSKIDEIYKNCDLFDFEITQALVGLRQKGALKVFK